MFYDVDLLSFTFSVLVKYVLFISFLYALCKYCKFTFTAVLLFICHITEFCYLFLLPEDSCA